MSEKIKINDVFFTIQGEGYNMGRRALFVRMPECNLSCSWCDTEFDSFKEWDEEQLIGFATSEGARFAVLTGGEPLKNPQLTRVISILTALGFEIAVETNGTYPVKAGIDWLTCSPKRDAAYKIHRGLAPYVNWVTCSPKGDAAYKIHRGLAPYVKEYKYVVDDKFNFDLLDRHKASGKYFSTETHLWLSPEYGDFKRNVIRILAYIKENPEWRISLQTHKVMEIA